MRSRINRLRGWLAYQIAPGPSLTITTRRIQENTDAFSRKPEPQSNSWLQAYLTHQDGLAAAGQVSRAQAEARKAEALTAAARVRGSAWT